MNRISLESGYGLMLTLEKCLTGPWLCMLRHILGLGEGAVSEDLLDKVLGHTVNREKCACVYVSSNTSRSSCTSETQTMKMILRIGPSTIDTAKGLHSGYEAKPN